jgi:hypothetical protein
MPHILLLWTMAISTVTGTEHGNWRYLGTYENEAACRQAFVDLGRRDYSIYGRFVCEPYGLPPAPPALGPVVRY